MATKDNVIGLKARIDTLDLKSGVKEISKYVKEADNAFKNATAGMGKWSESTEGLTQKLKQLEKELEAYDAEIQAYQKEIARVSKLDGDRTKQLEALNDKLNKSIRNYKNTEQSISHYNDTLSKVEKNNKKAESSLGKLTKEIGDQKSKMADLADEYKSATLEYGKNSKEAKTLESQIKKLNSELAENEKKLKASEKATEDLTKDTDKAADSTGKFQKGLDGLKSIGGGIAKGLGAVGAAGAGIATAFLSTAGATKEYRTNMGKLEAGFTTSGLKAEQAADTYKKLFSVVADEGKATEATAMIGQLANSQEDLNKWVNISTGVYATFGESLPIENLAEAAMEASINGKITSGLADALNWAKINEYDFKVALEACATEQERQTLITETLNDVYTEASEKYQQLNGDVIESNKAQVELTDTMAKFGKKAEPIITTIKEGFAKILEEVLKLAEDVDFDAISKKIEDGFSYFTDTIIPAIVDGFQWIMDNKDTLIAGIGAIGAGMVAWNVVSIVQGLVGAIKAWTVATEGLTVAQKLMNLAMKANPIGIIVTLITGLITAIVLLWKNNDDFRNAVIEIWNKIKESIATAIGAVKTAIDKMVEWFKGLPKKIGEAFDKVKEIGKNLVEGIWNGIKDAKKWILDKIKGFGKSVLGGIKKVFGINSPAKETAEMGVYLVEGLEVGMEEEKANLEATAEGVAEDTLNALEDGLNDAEKIGKDVVEKVDKNLKNTQTLATNAISTAVSNTASVIENTKSSVDELNEALRETIDLANNVSSTSTGVSEKGLMDFTDEELANKKTNLQENFNTHLKEMGMLEATEGMTLQEAFDFVKKAKEIAAKKAEEARKKIGHNLINPNILSDPEMQKAIKDDARFSSYSKRISDIEILVPEINAIESEQDRRKAEAKEAADKEAARRKAIADAKAAEVARKKAEEARKKAEEFYKKSIENLKENTKYAESDRQFADDLLLKTPWEQLQSLLGEEAIDSATNGDGSKFFKRIEKLKEEIDFKATKFDEQTTFEEMTGTDKGTLEEWQKNLGVKIGNAVDSIKSHLAGLSQVLSGFFGNIWDNAINELETKLKEFNELREKELENYKKQNKEEQDDLKASLEKGEMNQEAYTLKQRELALGLAEETAKIEEQKRKEEEKTLKEKNELAEKQFNADKINSIASALINIAVQITKNLANPFMIASVSALGAAQVAAIASQNFVPAMAKGGIVNKPTMALVGEAGKEAVMPLENNTQWISELAYKLNGIMSKDLGGGLRNSYSNSYNNKNVTNYYNQTINSPKSLSRHDIYRNSKNLLSLKGRA